MTTDGDSRSFLEAVSCALNGIGYALRRQRSFRIIVIIGIVALLLAAFLGIDDDKFLLVILVSALVVTLELVNTSLELAEDVVHPQFHQLIKHSKDIAAGAVLIASITAVVVGIIVFAPALVDLVS